MLRSFINAMYITISIIAMTNPIGITILDKRDNIESISLTPEASTTPAEIISKNTKLGASRKNLMVPSPADMTKRRIKASITNNIPIIYIGNVLSFVSSYIVAKVSGLDSMGYYFKPFTAYSLIVALSIVAVICQTIPVIVHMVRKKKMQ